MKAAQGTVVFRHGTLALKDMQLYRRLTVAGSGKNFRLACGDGGVGFDEFGEHTAHGFNAQRKWGHIEKQHILHFAGKHTTLNRSTDGHYFIRIYALGWFLSEEFFYFLCDSRNAGGATHQNYFVNLAGIQG